MQAHLWLHQPHEPHPHPLPLNDAAAVCSAQRFSRAGVEHVGEKPGEAEALHVLLQHRDAKVDCRREPINTMVDIYTTPQHSHSLMKQAARWLPPCQPATHPTQQPRMCPPVLTVVVADSRCVHPNAVQHRHHLFAAGEGAHEGGVQAVAAEQHQRLLRGIAPHSAGKAGGATHGLHRTLLYVVDLRHSSSSSAAQCYVSQASSPQRSKQAADAQGAAGAGSSGTHVIEVQNGQLLCGAAAAITGAAAAAAVAAGGVDLRLLPAPAPACRGGRPADSGLAAAALQAAGGGDRSALASGPKDCYSGHVTQLSRWARPRNAQSPERVASPSRWRSCRPAVSKGLGC